MSFRHVPTTESSVNCYQPMYEPCAYTGSEFGFQDLDFHGTGRVPHTAAFNDVIRFYHDQ